MSANTFTTSGAYLVDDPEERLLPGRDGAEPTPAIEFTIVDNAWNEKRYKAKFITVTCTGKMMDTARQLRAKDPVTVAGRLDYRTYKGNDGNERVAFDIGFPQFLVPGVSREVLAARGGEPAAEKEERPAKTEKVEKRGSRFD